MPERLVSLLGVFVMLGLAFALCPRSPEATFRFVNFLLAAGRNDDALRVAQAAQSVDPDNRQVEKLISELRQLKETK